MLTVDTLHLPQDRTVKLLSSVSTVHSRSSQPDKQPSLSIEAVASVEILSPGMPKPNTTGGITHKMLVKLVDWLATLCWSYRIDDQGLHLTVELLKRVVRNLQPDRSKLQGFGAACLLLSCKYTSQKKRFTVTEIVEMCRRVYPQSQLLEMEAMVLESVGYDLEVTHTQRQLEEFAENSPRPLESQQKLQASFLLEVRLLLHQNSGGLSQLRAVSEVVEFVMGGAPSCLVRQLVQCLTNSSYKTVLNRHSERFDAQGYLAQLRDDFSR